MEGTKNKIEQFNTSHDARYDRIVPGTRFLEALEQIFQKLPRFGIGNLQPSRSWQKRALKNDRSHTRTTISAKPKRSTYGIHRLQYENRSPLVFCRMRKPLGNVQQYTAVLKVALGCLARGPGGKHTWQRGNVYKSQNSWNWKLVLVQPY